MSTRAVIIGRAAPPSTCYCQFCATDVACTKILVLSPCGHAACENCLVKCGAVAVTEKSYCPDVAEIRNPTCPFDRSRVEATRTVIFEAGPSEVSEAAGESESEIRQLESEVHPLARECAGLTRKISEARVDIKEFHKIMKLARDISTDCQNKTKATKRAMGLMK